MFLRAVIFTIYCFARYARAIPLAYNARFSRELSFCSSPQRREAIRDGKKRRYSHRIRPNFRARKIERSFVKERAADRSQSFRDTPYTHSVPNGLRSSSPPGGDSIKTDLRAGFMKTVRFSGQYFTDGGLFFFNAQNLQSFFLVLFFFCPNESPISTIPDHRRRNRDGRCTVRSQQHHCSASVCSSRRPFRLIIA